MTSRNPPFRAEHVGSLLRSDELKAAARGFSQGETGEAVYLDVLHREIGRVVSLQESIGLRSITDGEFGRSSWFGFFFERMTGFELRPRFSNFMTRKVMITNGRPASPTPR